MASRKSYRTAKRELATAPAPQGLDAPPRAELLGSEALDHACKAGELAPKFSLRDAGGNPVRLANLLLEGPVVLSFYPGDWCSHCVSDLNALGSISAAVERLGARLFAISSRASGAGLTRSARTKHPFPVLIDARAKVTKAFGLAIAVTSELRPKYDQLLCASGATDSDRWLLPIPGTYLIDQQGQIVYSFVAVNHRNRISHAEILTILQSLGARTLRGASFRPYSHRE